MTLLDRIRRNVELLHYCGIGSLRRFTRAGSPVTRVTMKGIGPIHLRLADSDFAAFKQVFVGREYDLRAIGGAGRRVAARYQAIHTAGRVPVIVDAGANVGAASLWFARTFADARIIAIEPDPENARLLRLNVAGTSRISVLEAAIAGSSGKVSLAGEGMGWAVQTVRSESGELPAITMNEALATIPNAEPFIAKIDIEGFESDLFAGDQGWIDRTPVIIVEPHDWLLPGRGTSRTFQAAMGVRNFELFISGENLIYVAADL
jgi:FkbM family methyltransferase